MGICIEKLVQFKEREMSVCVNDSMDITVVEDVIRLGDSAVLLEI